MLLLGQVSDDTVWLLCANALHSVVLLQDCHMSWSKREWNRMLWSHNNASNIVAFKSLMCSFLVSSFGIVACQTNDERWHPTMNTLNNNKNTLCASNVKFFEWLPMCTTDSMKLMVNSNILWCFRQRMYYTRLAQMKFPGINNGIWKHETVCVRDTEYAHSLILGKSRFIFTSLLGHNT